MIRSKSFLISLLIVSLIVIGSLTGFFYFQSKKLVGIELLDGKPPLYGRIVKNPDLIQERGLAGWLSATPENLAAIDLVIEPENLVASGFVLNESFEWNGTGFIEFSLWPLAGRSGIAILHPVDREKGRYIEQEVQVPEGKFKLVVGVANIVDMLQQQVGIGEFVGNCADVGIRIKIVELQSGKEFVLFDKIIRNGKWYDYSIDISDTFSNKKVKIIAESYAADGGCGIWNGEWAAVDYIDIQPY